MKINSFANVIPITSGVRSKRGDGEGGNARQQYDPNQTRKDNQDTEHQQKKQEPFDPKLIDDAVASFARDEFALASGLSAVVEGSGPGLKVHVRDCNGATLRQFSGEEFLKLREAATSQGHAPGLRTRGKILDQKL